MFNTLLTFLWLVFLAYWFSVSRGNKKTKRRRKTIWGGAATRTILILIIVLLWAFPVFSYQIFLPNLATRVIGLIICLSGLIFAVLSRRALGANWSASPAEVKEGHQLITAGPYKLVRHPIYAGVITGLLGTFIAAGKLHLLILLVLVAIGMFIRSRAEDKLMSQEFPAIYSEYKKKTKAFIPKVL